MSKAVQRTLEAKLAALEGPEWDSSDEETPMVPLESSTKTTTASSSSKSSKDSGSSKVSKGKQSKKKKTKQQQEEESPDETTSASRVIYVGHLPREFEEPELRGFLQQFGVVTNIHLSRSKRTANSRGYAFCEFASSKTAAIVADTMSGYLMSQKKLVCHVVPNDKIHPSLFAHADKKFVKMDWRGMHREKVNSTKNASQMQRITRQLLKRERKKRQKLKEMGVEYDFPGYKESAKEMEAKKRALGDDAEETSETGGTNKKRKTESDDTENADSTNVDERELSEVEEETPDTGGPDKKKPKKKQRKMSDASDSSKVENKKKKRTMSDASVEEEDKKETKSVKTPAKQLDRKTSKSEETKSKRSKKAAKKRRASTYTRR